jgi:hypothetical protein
MSCFSYHKLLASYGMSCSSLCRQTYNLITQYCSIVYCIFLVGTIQCVYFWLVITALGNAVSHNGPVASAHMICCFAIFLTKINYVHGLTFQTTLVLCFIIVIMTSWLQVNILKGLSKLPFFNFLTEGSLWVSICVMVPQNFFLTNPVSVVQCKLFMSSVTIVSCFILLSV